MTISWPNTLSLPEDISSSVQRNPRVFYHQFGDGYQAGTPDGLNNNPCLYTVQYRNLNPQDHAILVDFVNNVASTGATVTKSIIPEDPSGAKTGLFKIVSNYSFSPDEGGSLFNWTVPLQQVYL